TAAGTCGTSLASIVSDLAETSRPVQARIVRPLRSCDAKTIGRGTRDAGTSRQTIEAGAVLMSPKRRSGGRAPAMRWQKGRWKKQAGAKADEAATECA